MRLLYIASGIPSLAQLDPNLIRGFRTLAKERADFGFAVFDPSQSRIGTLFRIIRSFRPETAVSLRGSLPAPTVIRIRKRGVPVGLYIVDDPYSYAHHLKMVRPYSYMITQDSACVPHYRRQGIPSLHLPLAVDPANYRFMQTGPGYQSEICFVGSATAARLQMIDGMAEYLKDRKFILIGRWWDRLQNYDKLKHAIINRPLPPAEVARHYNGATIVWNFHRTPDDVRRNPDHIPAFTPNNKTFEIAACGSFQLVSHRRDLERFYRMGTEMVSFAGLQDLKQKTQHYLERGEERERIAARARLRTMREHTYRVRLRHFTTTLKAMLPDIRP